MSSLLITNGQLVTLDKENRFIKNGKVALQLPNKLLAMFYYYSLNFLTKGYSNFVRSTAS